MTVNAGALALPTLLKLADVLAAKGQVGLPHSMSCLHYLTR